MLAMNSASSHALAPPLHSLHTLIGSDVYNHRIDELGDILDLVVNLRTGRIHFALLRCHPESGCAEKLVAVPWSQLTLDEEMRCFRLDASLQHLAAAPAFAGHAQARHVSRLLQYTSRS